MSRKSIALLSCSLLLGMIGLLAFPDDRDCQDSFFLRGKVSDFVLETGLEGVGVKVVTEDGNDFGEDVTNMEGAYQIGDLPCNKDLTAYFRRVGYLAYPTIDEIDNRSPEARLDILLIQEDGEDSYYAELARGILERSTNEEALEERLAYLDDLGLPPRHLQFVRSQLQQEQFPNRYPKGLSDWPRIAVLEIKNKADNRYWWHGGGEAAQDVFVTELEKSGKFRVIERERINAIMQEKGLILSGDVDPATAMQIGKLLGADYLLAGAVTEYGVDSAEGGAGSVGGLPSFGFKKKDFTAAINARIFDVNTGEIVWADESRHTDSAVKVRVGGIGGGTDDRRMFDKVMKPAIQDLVASLRAADL